MARIGKQNSPIWSIMNSIDQSNEERSKIVISELIKSSVRYFLIAPGSRSTPLTLAAAQNPLAETVVHFDERGLAFHGLGIAKATSLPVCLICTSGTALMNFYPAVVEASKSQVPMIILAADRPPELRDTGANQTIDQVKPFGSYCRWEIDFAFQDLSLPQSAIASTINHAVYRSMTSPAGPVLINCMIREPLLSKKSVSQFTMDISPLPKTRYYLCQRSLPDEEFQYVADELSQYEKGVILVGSQTLTFEEESILSLAMKLQWPVFADPLSKVRELGRDTHLIHHYNYILTVTAAKEKMTPDVVLHLGGHIVSKHLNKWIESLKLKKYLHVANFPNKHDPSHIVTDRIEMEGAAFCKSLCSFLKGRPPSLWLSLWKEYAFEVEEVLTQIFEENKALSEPFAVHSIEDRVLKDCSFFFASSLSIRYADSLFFPRERIGTIYANRGASGIDGTIATAIGVARAHKTRVLAVLGDLAFLHDVNSLALLEKESLPITFLVLNNEGGGIFHFLPVAERKEHFEKFIEAKHSFSMKAFAKAFNIPYHCPKQQLEYLDTLEEFTKIDTPNMIEVKTTGRENHDLYQQIEKVLQNRLSRSKKEKGLYSLFS